MSKETTPLINYDSTNLFARIPTHSWSSPPIFILCDNCYWCATYLDKTRIPSENGCPKCNANNNQLTSFPIMANESFSFDHTNKRGVELEFKPDRRSMF
jgi:hypothetical protein